MSLLTYKGYTADVEYDAQEGILYGRVLDLRDTITFQSESAMKIADEFHPSSVPRRKSRSRCTV